MEALDNPRLSGIMAGECRLPEEAMVQGCWYSLRMKDVGLFARLEDLDLCA